MPVWLVHKTRGVTSFDALAAVRPPGKACHGGSLDPFATGLLPVLIGSAVHVFPAIHELPKTYLATVAWGSETDNGDLLGKVVAEGNPQFDVPPTPQLGWQDQVPPAFSNKRVNGERAWKLARAGEHVELPPQQVYLHSAEWLSRDQLRVVVRGGFYVRSLARDLGRQLGCYAHLSALHREAIGPWACPAELQKLELDDALRWLPTRVLTDAEVGALRKKQPIGEGRLEAAQWKLPAGFPPVTFVRGVHLGKTSALLRTDGSAAAWL